MPGRWVGGKGSRACPEKDSIFEAEVFQDDGSPQGTVLLVVRRLYSPGENGRFLLADHISASDEYYRYWVGSPEGAAAVREGNYHLCKVAPKECPAKSKAHLTIHLGRWRTFKQEELVRANLPDYPKEALGEIEAFFKKEGREGRSATREAGLPWGEVTPSPTAMPSRVPGAPAVVPRRARVREDKKAGDGGSPVKGKDRTKLTELQKELAALKKRVSEEEARMGGRRGEKRKGKEVEVVRRKPPPKAFGTGLDKGGRAPAGGPPSESPGDSEGNGESDEDESEDEPGSSPEDKDDHPKKETKRPRKGDKDSGDERKPSRGREAGRKSGKKKRKKKKRTKSKKGERRDDKGSKKKKKDRGPFGVARTEEWTQGDSKESSESSSSVESDFHKASGEKSLQLKLVRYAQRHPGRLATRLLRLMAKAVGFSSGALTSKSPTMKEAPATAHLYFLTVLTPALNTKWTARTAREMKCWATILDLLAEGKGPEAADIASQRLKALERSVHDGNAWRRARYLELVDPEDHLLTDKGEEKMMNRELELEEKSRGKGNWSLWDPDPKGGKGKKGKEGGKGKGGGKGKNPSENVATKAEKGS